MSIHAINTISLTSTNVNSVIKQFAVPVMTTEAMMVSNMGCVTRHPRIWIRWRSSSDSEVCSAVIERINWYEKAGDLRADKVELVGASAPVEMILECESSVLSATLCSAATDDCCTNEVLEGLWDLGNSFSVSDRWSVWLVCDLGDVSAIGMTEGSSDCFNWLIDCWCDE